MLSAESDSFVMLMATLYFIGHVKNTPIHNATVIRSLNGGGTFLIFASIPQLMPGAATPICSHTLC